MLDLFAQAVVDPAAVVETPWYKAGALGYMIDGGLFMWPILVMAVLGTAVVIERFRTLGMLATDSSALRHQVLQLLYEDRVEEAIALCNRSRGPVPAILTVGLQRYEVLRKLNTEPDRIEELVDKAMDEYGPHITAALERHMPILATIANVAPMVGSIGTVVGMVMLFQGIVEMPSDGQLVKVAAAGIQVKLLVTAFGLMVGVPAYIAYTYFNTRISRFVLEAEETASKLIEALTVRLSSGGTAPADRPAAAVAP